MDEHERIIIENTKAHIRALRGELSVVNDSLTATIRARDEELSRLASVRNDVELALSELAKTREITAADILEASARVKSVEEREALLSAERTKFDEYRTKALRELEAGTQVLDTKIAEKQSELDYIADSVVSVRNTLHSTLASIQQAETKKATLQSELNRIATEKELASKDLEEQKLKITAELSSAQKELSEIASKIAQHNAAFANKKSDLSEREEAITKREANFEIMYRRLYKEFKTLHPDQELNI